MNKLMEKMVAIVLVLVLATANLFVLGSSVYALTDTQLANQTTTTQNANVEFNAYLNEGGHSKTEQRGSKKSKLYLNIKVKNAGYLKNGVVTFKDSNFKIDTDFKNDLVQKFDVDKNQIILKQINNGSDATIEVPIVMLEEERVSEDNFAKETTTQFTGTYVDKDGKEKAVSKAIINKLSWDMDAEIETKTTLTKYIPYAVDGKYGVMVQAKVNSNVKDNVLPVQKTEIAIQSPEINNTKPTSVTVIANNTKATNGQTDGVSFVKDNYTYDANTGMVNIAVENAKDSSEKIAWVKNAVDEYLVTFIYEGQDIYNFAKANSLKTDMIVNNKLTLFNGVETIKEKTVTASLKADEKLGTITDFNMDITDKVGKGYLYANYTIKKKVETDYQLTYSAIISNANLVDEITFTQSIDTFMTKENAKAPTTVSDNNYTYNKAVKISELVFNKMLGEDGHITISDEDGTELGIINKETPKDNNGNYVLDISKNNVNQLDIITTKPITEGQVTIVIEKAVKGKIDYSEEQVKTFNKLESNLTGKAGASTVTNSTQMLMEEVKSVANVEVNKTDLTTVVKNENVEIRGVLDTSSIYNALYTNPTLKFKLPSYITNVDIKSSKILMDKGLKIKTTNVATEDGALVINVILEGTQEGYTIDAEYKGTIVTISADLTVDPLTPSNENKIIMIYTNENKDAINQNGEVETALNFVAPTGVVAANEMANYQNQASVMSISDESKTVEIDTYADKKIVTISGTVINNYSNKISDIVVLGRFPAKDITKIDTNDQLGSTFNTTLKNTLKISGIDNNKYTVYYSENANATTDLNNKNNGWSTKATTAAKSYMIVTKDYVMAAGDKIEFSYDAELPDNLSHNNEVYQMYKVYYNNIADIGTMAETKVSPIMALSTGEGPELAGNISTAATTIREGQIVKMKATVENTGEITAENVKVHVKAPKYTTLVEQTSMGYFEDTTPEYLVGTLKKGETAEVIYYLKIDDETVIYGGDPSTMTPEEMDEIAESQIFPKEIINQVTITADDIEGEIPSAEYKMQVQDGKLALELISDILEEQVLVKGNTIKYALDIRNIGTDGTYSNVVVNIPLPEGIEYQKAVLKDTVADTETTTDGINFDEKTNLLKVTIPTLENNKTIEFEVKVGDISDSFAFSATATADGVDEQYSNVTEYKAEEINLEVSELTSTPKYVKETENITYTLKVTNKGKSTVKGVTVVDQLPEGLTLEKATYTYGEGEEVVTTAENNKIEIIISQMAAGATSNITIIAKADLLPDQNDKEVTNQVTVSATSFEPVKTNTVTNIIEYYAGAHTDEGGDNPSIVGRYKITGTAWVDANQDGKRDADETLLGGMTVLLLNKDDNSIVTDPDTNQPKQVTTDSNGKYEFNNLPKGEYLVVFLYDAANYSLTTYQAQGVDTSLNSDAIDINITYEGERRIAGITDVLNITNSNIRDIDIGLYSAEKFDLRLDKYINKITLTTPTIGTRVDEYNNDKTGKVEILGRNAGKSSIVIEYKIVVTNEGAVPGYVKKIVDYLPEDVNFATDLNKDWYLSDNGNVYNASLENEKINPGESKEVTLLVTKKLTEESLGTVINNNAEIYEAYNELGLQDIDSTPGNKAENEDDMSEANVVLSIVTGKIILYTTLAIAVIAIIGFSAYIIKKRVLDKKV